MMTMKKQNNPNTKIDRPRAGLIRRLLFAVMTAPLSVAVTAQEIENTVTTLSESQTITDRADLPGGIAFVLDGYDIPEGNYSILVENLTQPETLVRINTTAAMQPASTIKTLTTLVALHELGPDYQWPTELYALGPVDSDGNLNGDLLIRGQGDPFLVEEQVRAMLKSLMQQGIQHIHGNLVIDTSAFAEEVWQGSAMDGQSGRAYNVYPHPLLMNFQVNNFIFRPAPEGENEVTILNDPPLHNLIIDNQLTLRQGACNGFQRGIRADVFPAENRIRFSGAFPNRCEQYRMTRSSMKASDYAYGLISLLWQQLGGTLSGDVVEDNSGARLALQPDLQPATVHWSPPLGEIIRSINKYSNNVMTRLLMLTLGHQLEESATTLSAGQQAIYDFLTERQIPHMSLVLDNGSGLSRETRISADDLGAALNFAWHSPYMPEFLASLPLSGMDGTMSTRLTDSTARGRMHVKTGSLDDVAGVAGYVYSQSGDQYLVIVMLNHEAADQGLGQELSDVVLAWTVRQ